VQGLLYVGAVLTAMGGDREAP